MAAAAGVARGEKKIDAERADGKMTRQRLLYLFT
jgi:hypothetical protein